MKITKNTYIVSPRWIASGLGAWQGDVEDLFEYTDENFWNRFDAVVEYLPFSPYKHDEENEEDDYISGREWILTLTEEQFAEFISDFLDDPNISFYDSYEEYLEEVKKEKEEE